MGIILLPDLAAAFDTVDNTITLGKLEQVFRLKDVYSTRFAPICRGWNNMYQYTKPSRMKSLSQRSVLRPLLFILYTFSFASIARRHGICIDMYADDTQLYTTMDISYETSWVVFYENLSMKQHIIYICKSSFIQLRNIRCLKSHLSADPLKTVAHAFVASRIDCGNSLVIGIPDRCVNQLQRTQNCNACLWINTQKYDHI